MNRVAFFSLTVFLLSVPSPALAQSQRTPGANTETRSGTVKEVIYRGRNATLVVNSDGEELSFPMTAKVQLEVKLSGGDATALQPGASIEGEGFVSNSNLILGKATVYLPADAGTIKGTPLVIEKPEEKVIGQRVTARHLTGQILQRQPSQNFEGYDELIFKAPPNSPKILFKKGIAIEVISADPKEIQPDQAVELELLTSRSRKPTLIRAIIEGGKYSPPAEGETEKKKTSK
ncbi:MAG TPA: hypothetical protein VNQ76_17745 [Planctomicrobium sp.]|nr:hypothetical protein [Planctomicrobium sp.]